MGQESYGRSKPNSYKTEHAYSEKTPAFSLFGVYTRDK